MSNILKFPNFVFGYKNILKTENKKRQRTSPKIEVLIGVASLNIYNKIEFK